MGCLLGCLVTGLLVLGVVGPAGANGICTLEVGTCIWAGCSDAVSVSGGSFAISGVALATAGVASASESGRGVMFAIDGTMDA